MESNGREAVCTNAEESGDFLTWEDLWVTVSNGRNCTRPILQGLTGYAKPGQLLAIMGPSGCGKSTLLDALAGRLGSKMRQTGEVLINGHKEELSYGMLAYVTRDDALLTTLTVRETVHCSAQLQLPDTMSWSEKKERADFTIKEMGLQDVINTYVGGCGAKGISNGQRMRLSICIEMLTRPGILFLDEPTSGLDSAGSYHVMGRIASLSQRDGIKRTIIASIHQPSAEVFQLFHNLCLMSSGKTVYFGPASAANEFFTLNGFPCPTLHNPSDHFLRIINKDFELDSEPGLPGRVTTEEAINILVKSMSSETNQKLRKEVAEISSRGCGTTVKKENHAGFLAQCFTLTRRSCMNMCRDVGYYWLRLAINIGLAVSLGSIFRNVGSRNGSIQATASLIVFVAIFPTFISISGFPSFVEEMKVFQRERLNGHYGVTAFIVSNTLSSFPFLLLIALIPGAIAYHFAGLHKGFEHFMYFICVLFSSSMLVESLMMVVATAVPNFLMGIIAGSGIVGIMMLVSGFYRLPSDLPKLVWKYPLHYIAFLKYTFQGLLKNEFEGLTFAASQVGGLAITNGQEVLRNVWQVDLGHSKWVDLSVLLGMVVLFRVTFLFIIKTQEKVKPAIDALKKEWPKKRVLGNTNSTPSPQEPLTFL